MTPFDLDTLRAETPQLRRLARAIVGEAYADDIVQEAWAAALGRRGEAPRNWGAWLSRVTRNLAWNQRNKARNEHARAVDVFDADRAGQGADDVAARIEEKHVMERAILELEEPYRSALLWRYYEDLSVEEISRRAGTIPSTTRSHLQRGLDRLRARLESEKGTDWRLALVPFLRLPEPAAKAALVAGATGAGLLTIHKIMIAAVIAAAFLALNLERLQGVDGDGEDLAALVVPASDELLAPEPAGEPLETVAAPVDVPRAAAIETAAAPAAAPAPSLPAVSTTLQLVDFKSGLPLPGVAFDAHYTVTKRRFFFARQESATVSLTTDEEGRATLPAAVDDRGAIDGNPIHAKVYSGPNGAARGFDRTEYLSVLGTLPDGTVQLSAEPAAAFWVRLPDALTAEEIDALDARLMITSLGQVSNLSSPFAPLAMRERDLLFLVPNHVETVGWQRQEEATLHIATTDTGPCYRANVPRDVSLADAPTLAERSSDVVQRVRILDGSTNEPVEGATIVFRGKEKSDLNTYSVARTDDDGRARLFGIPQGARSIEVGKEGYELLTVAREIMLFESFDLRLRKKADLREVRVILRSEKGQGVSFMNLAAYELEISRALQRQNVIETRKKGEGWEGTVVLEHIPARPVFLDLSFHGHAHAPQGPIRVEPDQDAITIDVGPETPRLGLVLRLPPGVEVKYRQRIGDGPEYSHQGSFQDGSQVTSVAIDGRPVYWTIEAPGYLPVIGTERDLIEGEHEGKRCMELRPALVEGDGLMLSAGLWAPRDDVPTAFHRTTPLAGVRFTRPDTGETLGVTDASGHLVVSSDRALGKIAATYQGKTQVLVHKGEYEGLDFTFRE